MLRVLSNRRSRVGDRLTRCCLIQCHTKYFSLA
nr:MAG TPA: hypothetical protein [Caudoviricetes sp.]